MLALAAVLLSTQPSVGSAVSAAKTQQVAKAQELTLFTTVSIDNSWVGNLQRISLFVSERKRADGTSEPVYTAVRRSKEGESYATSDTCDFKPVLVFLKLIGPSVLDVPGMVLGGTRPTPPGLGHTYFQVKNYNAPQYDGSPVDVTLTSSEGNVAKWVNSFAKDLNSCWKEVPNGVSFPEFPVEKEPESEPVVIGKPLTTSFFASLLVENKLSGQRDRITLSSRYIRLSNGDLHHQRIAQRKGVSGAAYTDSDTCDFRRSLFLLRAVVPTALNAPGARPADPPPKPHPGNTVWYTVSNAGVLQNGGEPMHVQMSANSGYLAEWSKGLLDQLQPCWTTPPADLD